MLLPKNRISLEYTQPCCHNNGIYQTRVAMTMRYILNISSCHDDRIYLTSVSMTMEYIKTHNSELQDQEEPATTE